MTSPLDLAIEEAAARVDATDGYVKAAADLLARWDAGDSTARKMFTRTEITAQSHTVTGMNAEAINAWRALLDLRARLSEEAVR